MTPQLTERQQYLNLLDACENGRVGEATEILESQPQLLKAGYELQDSQGMSLLIAATQWGQTDAVTLLLKHGASAGYRDTQGLNAGDWADKQGFSSISAILREAETRQAEATRLEEIRRQAEELAGHFTEGLKAPVTANNPLRLKNKP
jgi:ankyrin repeat protein